MINEKILCYLTEDAAKAVSEMVESGIDQDLAVSILEQLWDEQSIYDIPARDTAP